MSSFHVLSKFLEWPEIYFWEYVCIRWTFSEENISKKIITRKQNKKEFNIFVWIFSHQSLVMTKTLFFLKLCSFFYWMMVLVVWICVCKWMNGCAFVLGCLMRRLSYTQILERKGGEAGWNKKIDRRKNIWYKEKRTSDQQLWFEIEWVICVLDRYKYTVFCI